MLSLGRPGKPNSVWQGQPLVGVTHEALKERLNMRSRSPDVEMTDKENSQQQVEPAEGRGHVDCTWQSPMGGSTPEPTRAIT